MLKRKKEVNKLNSHVLDACKMALLVAGGNTGFIKGVRHESQSLIVPTSQAYDKKGNLKTQLVEDIFWFLKINYRYYSF